MMESYENEADFRPVKAKQYNLFLLTSLGSLSAFAFARQKKLIVFFGYHWVQIRIDLFGLDIGDISEILV